MRSLHLGILGVEDDKDDEAQIFYGKLLFVHQAWFCNILMSNDCEIKWIRVQNFDFWLRIVLCISRSNFDCALKDVLFFDCMFIDIYLFHFCVCFIDSAFIILRVLQKIYIDKHLLSLTHNFKYIYLDKQNLEIYSITYTFKILNTDIALWDDYIANNMFIYILGANESAVLYLRRGICLTPKKRNSFFFFNCKLEILNRNFLFWNFNLGQGIKWGIWFGIVCGNTRFSVAGWSIFFSWRQTLFYQSHSST